MGDYNNIISNRTSRYVTWGENRNIVTTSTGITENQPDVFRAKYQPKSPKRLRGGARLPAGTAPALAGRGSARTHKPPKGGRHAQGERSRPRAP